MEIEDTELKWSKINAFRVESYCAIMDGFFDMVAEGLIKVRVMFSDNRYLPTALKEGHREMEYHLLYYQFIKHAFGLRYLESDVELALELYFDMLPQSKEKNKAFKRYIYGLQFLPELSGANLSIREDAIYEVDSKKHLILQCVDIVLGAMAFRLNDHYKDKPEGQYRRGKRTVAKERVYKHINRRIRQIRPNFNIGITTRTVDLADRFADAYRHWIFKPKDSVYLGGNKKEKRPSTF